MDISYLTEGMYTVPWATVPTHQKFADMSNEIVITRHHNLWISAFHISLYVFIL